MLSKEYFSLDRFTTDDLKAFHERYKDDPILFSQEILGIDPDDNQRTIIQSVLDNKYSSVGSGRGIGKTYTISILAGWTLCVKPEAVVLVSSNTASQSKSTIWAPLCKILRASAIGEWFEYTTEMIHFKGDSATAYIKRLIWSEASVESVAGYHSPNMLYLLDEASKYPSSVIDTMRGSCTQDWNKMLLTSNPTLTSGYFYETYSSKRWNFMEIDSRSSLHTNKKEIDDVIEEYGIDSDYVRVQVLGKFPRQSSTSIIAPDLLNTSFASPLPHNTDNELTTIGLDVGGGKDKSCWVVRKGLSILEVVTLQTPTEEAIITKTQELHVKYKANKLLFDKTGIGFFLGEKLGQRLPPGIDIRGIGFGDGSLTMDCANMRSYIYKRLSDWFKAGGIIGNQVAIKKQLVATTYVMDQKGRIQLVPKKDIIKEIGHSPDEADALALSCGFEGNLTSGGGLTHKSFARAVSHGFMEAGKW